MFTMKFQDLSPQELVDMQVVRGTEVGELKKVVQDESRIVRAAGIQDELRQDYVGVRMPSLLQIDTFVEGYLASHPRFILEGEAFAAETIRDIHELYTDQRRRQDDPRPRLGDTLEHAARIALDSVISENVTPAYPALEVLRDLVSQEEVFVGKMTRNRPAVTPSAPAVAAAVVAPEAEIVLPPLPSTALVSVDQLTPIERKRLNLSNDQLPALIQEFGLTQENVSDLVHLNERSDIQARGVLAILSDGHNFELAVSAAVVSTTVAEHLDGIRVLEALNLRGLTTEQKFALEADQNIISMRQVAQVMKQFDLSDEEACHAILEIQASYDPLRRGVVRRVGLRNAIDQVLKDAREMETNNLQTVLEGFRDSL